MIGPTPVLNSQFNKVVQYFVFYLILVIQKHPFLTRRLSALGIPALQSLSWIALCLISLEDFL